MYSVLLASAAQREFRKLPREHVERVTDSLASLAEDPRTNAEKLQGEDAFRIRVGRYRVVFRVDDHAREVLVVRIAHRREVYRRR